MTLTGQEKAFNARSALPEPVDQPETLFEGNHLVRFPVHDKDGDGVRVGIVQGTGLQGDVPFLFYGITEEESAVGIGIFLIRNSWTSSEGP